MQYLSYCCALEQIIFVYPAAHCLKCIVQADGLPVMAVFVYNYYTNVL